VVAVGQPRKVEVFPWRHQVVAAFLGESEELVGDDGTQFVPARIAVELPTEPVAERTGRGVRAAGFQWVAVDVAVVVIGVGGHGPCWHSGCKSVWLSTANCRA